MPSTEINAVRKNRRGADIDITPLIDMMFMLIIFFVLTTSFIQGGLDVDLPDGRAPASESKDVSLITVKKNGHIDWDGKAVTLAEVPEAAKQSKAKNVMVAGDKEVPYGDMAHLLSILRENGVPSASLMLSGEKK